MGWIKVGQIVGSHSHKGLIRVKSFTTEAMDLFNYSNLHIDSKPIELTYQHTSKGNLVCQIAGVDTLEQAKDLFRLYLTIPEENLPKLSENEFYYHDLVNLSVVTEDGKKYGYIKAVQDIAGDAILEVKGEDKSFMLLFIPEVIMQVNLKKQEVIVKKQVLDTWI